jgi:hypothetical protein
MDSRKARSIGCPDLGTPNPEASFGVHALAARE